MDTESFVELSRGRCHFRCDGPASGPVVLLVHGATVPSWEFDRLTPHLVRGGFRALRADLFGHGRSDRPRLAYDHALFVDQLLELLDAVVPGERVHLVGHSLGAAIAARMVARSARRFASAALAAPLLDFTGNARATGLLRVPLLGECLMPAYVLPMLVRRRTRAYRGIEDGRFVGLFREQLERPGFGRALLSLFRCGSLDDQSECYRALAGHPTPVLLLHGTLDRIVTAAQIEQLRRLLPGARYRAIEGTAHAFILTHPEQVAVPLLAFLQQVDGHAGRVQRAQDQAPAPDLAGASS